jgi:hypothetical protein
MNSKEVLKKIVTMLSLSKEEVLFTYAKLADGTILESPTFDVGEAVDVVSEDGKSPAPNGEHEVILKDTEGNDVRIKIQVADGKITERENVELPAADTEGETSEAVEMESIAGDDMGDGEGDSPLAIDTAEPIEEDMGKMMQKLQYRIEEMEKKITKMEEAGIPVNEDKVSEGTEAEIKKGEKLPEMMAAIDPEEEELPKLDGAPVEEAALPKVNKFGKMNGSAQSRFLSKIYK